MMWFRLLILPVLPLIEIGSDHWLADQEQLAVMLGASGER